MNVMDVSSEVRTTSLGSAKCEKYKYELYF